MFAANTEIVSFPMAHTVRRYGLYNLTAHLFIVTFSQPLSF